MAKQIYDKLGACTKPIAALIVYKNNRYYEHYLETRPIKEDGTLGRAKPVSWKFLQKLADIVHKIEKEKDTVRYPHGAVPPNLLKINSNPEEQEFVWWTPPEKHQCYFMQKCGVPDGIYHMPGCVFHVKRHNLHVYCFKGKKPDHKEKLLKGPFFNYYNDGGVCLGNSKLDWPQKITWKDILEHWESIFWNSVNSHSIDNPMKEGQNLVVAIKESSDKPFDTEKLDEFNFTLESLLK